MYVYMYKCKYTVMCIIDLFYKLIPSLPYEVL